MTYSMSERISPLLNITQPFVLLQEIATLTQEVALKQSSHSDPLLCLARCTE